MTCAMGLGESLSFFSIDHEVDSSEGIWISTSSLCQQSGLLHIWDGGSELGLDQRILMTRCSRDPASMGRLWALTDIYSVLVLRVSPSRWRRPWFLLRTRAGRGHRTNIVGSLLRKQRTMEGTRIILIP